MNNTFNERTELLLDTRNLFVDVIFKQLDGNPSKMTLVPKFHDYTE